MNALLAILKDSFWSIYATKILHLSVGLVLIILLVLSPFSYVEKVTSKIFHRDVNRIDRIFEKLNESRKSDKESLTKQFWECLNKDQKAKLNAAEEISNEKDAHPREKRNARNELITVFNQVIENGALVEAASKDLVNNKEAKDILSRSDLLAKKASKDRLGRLLLSDAFGRSIESGSQANVTITYAGFELPESPLNRLMLEGYIRDATPYILDKFVFSIGILVAIIFTASIVPQMLESGSLYLLLSKPISRFFLICSKFLGSTLFVLIFSTILLGGVWLILGIRFHLWINTLLWCIPIYLIVFMVYYSVTMCVGLVTRNTIAAIVVTAVFWGFCFVFTTTNFFYVVFLTFYQSKEIVAISDITFRRTPQGILETLDEKNQWSGPIKLANKGPNPMIPSFSISNPVAWEGKQQLLCVVKERNRKRQTTTSLYSLSHNDKKIELATKAIEAPTNMQSLYFDKNGNLLGVSDQGSVYQLDPQALKDLENGELNNSNENESESKNESNSILGSVFKNLQKIEAGSKTKNKLWAYIGTICDSKIPSRSNIRFDKTNDTFYIQTRHKIFASQFNAVSGNYEQSLEKPIPWNYKLSLEIPFGLTEKSLIFPLRNGPVVVLDKQTLEAKKEFLVSEKNPLGSTPSAHPRYFAIAYGEGGIWIFDDQNESMIQSVQSNGYNCTGVDIQADGRIEFGFGYNRVGSLSPETWSFDKRKPVNVGTFVLIYDWGLQPIYSILPKPAECFVLVQHLSKDSTAEVEALSRAPQQDVMLADSIQNNAGSPYKPVITSAIFAFVVMMFNGLFFATREY